MRRDRCYDAITVRIFAAGYDYAVGDADGFVVSGSRTEERVWSEYWTFIRSASVSGREPT
jgi:predicted lipid-binding transport protein (Tim44 family)